MLAHNKYLQPGGEDRVVEAEAQLLSDHEHVVDTFSVQNTSGARAALDLALSVWNPATSAKLSHRADVFRPDVIHVHNTWFRFSPSVLRMRPPMVLTLHNYRLTCANAHLFKEGRPCRLCIDGSSINAVINGCYRNTLASIPAAANVAIHKRLGTYQRHVDMFTTFTEFARELMVEAGLPEDRIIVKPNFVADPGAIHPQSERDERVVFVGRIEAAKGVLSLAEVWRRSRPPFELLVVGDGPDRAAFDGVPGTRVTGWLRHDEVSRLISTARALVLPSLWYEGQPLAILEAFARGTPVVGTSHGGIGETLRPVAEDLLVDPGDTDSLADRIAALADDELIARAGKAGRVRYEQRHSPVAAIGALENVYSQAIKHSIDVD